MKAVAILANRGVAAGATLGLWGALLVGAAQPAAATEVATEAALRAAYADAGVEHIALTADVTLTCAGGGELFRFSATPVVIDGGGEQRVIAQTCANHRVIQKQGQGALTLRNVAVEAGDSGGFGGGILSEYDLVLEDSAVRDNIARNAGGILVEIGDLVVERSSITGNEGTGLSMNVHGIDAVGGIWAAGEVVLVDSTISGNIGTGGHKGAASGATGGAGIGALRVSGALTVLRSEISGNSGVGGNAFADTGATAGAGYGGIFAFSHATITDSTFTGNVGTGGSASVQTSQSAIGGSAIAGLRAPTATITSSELTENEATGGSGSGPETGIGGWAVGGLRLTEAAGDAVLSDVTVADNTAEGGNGVGGVGRGQGGDAVGGLRAGALLVHMADSVVSGNEGRGGLGDGNGAVGCCVGGGFGVGGLHADGLTLVDSTLDANVGAGGDDGNGVADGNRGGVGVGGALVNAFGDPVHIERSTVSRNTGSGGQGVKEGGPAAGGLWTPTDVTLLSSTVTGNTGEAGGATAEGTGGLTGNDVTLVHVTLAGNRGTHAGNLHTVENFGSPATVASFGSVLAESEGGPSCGDLGPDPVDTRGYNIDDDGSCGLGAGPGDGSGFGVPLELGDLSADVGPTATRPPALSSPLVDAIPLEACDGWDGLVPGPVTTDQRGVARPHGHGCDIGAVEVLERGVVRVFGPERTATAAAISARSFPAADTVFLATAFNFPDALAGGPLAAREPAPILLAGTTSLPAATGAELERLAPATLVVLGGTGAISDAVAAAAAAAAGGATIDRLAGPDRFTTAGAIAERYPTAARAYLSTGANFPDALTGAALAAARDDGPVLLTLRDTLPTATAAQLTRLAPGELIVLGGTGVVSDAVAQAAADAAGGAAITRLAGPDRFATAAAVANTFPAPTDVVYTATGHNFPDALTGTPAAAQTSSPILLTNRDTLPDPTITQLTRLTPLQIVILGGEGVVSAAVADTLTTHLR